MPAGTVIAIVAVVVASYAALVATASLAWNIYVARRDRGALRVKASVMLPTSMHTGKPTGDARVMLKVVNAGRRARLITAIGADDIKGGPRHWYVPTDSFSQQLPVELGEHKEATFLLPLELFRDSEAKNLCVQDSVEKRWYVSRKNFKQTKREALTALEEREKKAEAKRAGSRSADAKALRQYLEDNLKEEEGEEEKEDEAEEEAGEEDPEWFRSKSRKRET